MALRAAKSGSAGSRYVLYDETLRASLLKEQQLAGEMTTALDRGPVSYTHLSALRAGSSSGTESSVNAKAAVLKPSSCLSLIHI